MSLDRSNPFAWIGISFIDQYLLGARKLAIIELMEFIAFISIDPNVRFGKPCVKNTRISVYDVLGWLASGMSFEQIISDFPELSDEAIRACLAFAADREHKYKIAS